jgi:hypothetical protein
MTFAKLSDDYSDDCWSLSDAAFRLHTEALVWSNRKLLDCRIPVDDLRRFAKHPEAAADLVATGWWSKAGDHYVIRHHAQYQQDRDSVLRKQAASRANGAKGGRPSKKDAGQGRERWQENPDHNPAGLVARHPSWGARGTGLDRKGIALKGRTNNLGEHAG